MEALVTLVTRHPLATGVALVALFFPIALVSTGPLNDGPEDLPYVLWSLAFALPLLWAAHRPQVALGLSAIPLAIQGAVADVPLAADTTVLVALAFLAAREPWRRARWWVGGVLVVAAFFAYRWTVHPGSTFFDTGELVSALSGFAVIVGLVAAAVTLGALVRSQQEQVRTLQELAASLERDRQLAGDLAAAQERARIAADMHDVVAHSLAVIAVQTDAAQLLLSQGEADSRAVRAVGAAHGASVQALRETRRIVGTLTDAARSPQPATDPRGAA